MGNTDSQIIEHIKCNYCSLDLTVCKHCVHKFIKHELNTIYLEKLHSASLNNKKTINASPQCICFYCMNILNSNTIKEYLSDNSGICPKCGIDSLLPSALFNSSDVMIKAALAMQKKYF